MDTDTDLIGLGRTGRIMRHGTSALKTANIWPVPTDAPEVTAINIRITNDMNATSLAHEGHVYRRLAGVPGIIQQLKITDTEIHLPFVAGGSLDAYLMPTKNFVTCSRIRLHWLCKAAHTLRRAHDCGVIVVDIAVRNFFLVDGACEQHVVVYV